MKDWYFYLEQGKAAGPFSPDEMKKAIVEGRVGPHDLLFRDGAQRWEPGYQFSEFRQLFKNPVKAEIDDSWVVLTRKRTDAGVSYLQRGPYSTQTVRELLQKGEVEYRDFIWREGQSKWLRISSIEIFNPPPIAWHAPNSLPEDVEEFKTSGDELAHVIRAQPQDVLKEDEVPPEAGTQDQIVNTQTDASMVRRSPRSPSQRDFAQERRRRHLVSPVSVERRSFPVLWISVLALVSVIGVGIWSHREEILHRFGVKRVVKEGKAESGGELKKSPIQPEEATVAKVKAPSPAPPPPPEPEEPKVEPTRLKIAFMSGRDGQELRFFTDASHHFQVRVKIVGEAGEVLEKVSVYREISVKRAPKEDFSLDLSALDLGDGPYLAEATVGEIRSKIHFRIGRKDAEFARRLERHRKLISLPFQRERRRLIRAAASLIQISERTQSTKWRQEMNRWRQERFDGINLKKPQALVFPDLWMKLADCYEERLRAGEDPGSKRAAWLDTAKSLQAEIGQLNLYR